MADGVEQGDLVRGTRRSTRELEPEVLNRLHECEVRIERAYDDAWHALKEIHDDQLYKADGYSSFKNYVEQRWGYSKSKAHRLIDHVRIVEYLKEQGVENLPTSEAHTTALTKLRRISKSEDDFLQRAGNAWEMAVDTAPKQFDVPKVTANHVESSMQHFGVYRNAKRKNPDEDADEISSALAKVTQCAAFKMTPAKFHEKHGRKGQSSQFYELVSWLNAYADLCAGETD
jgi:hypothetical protein